jgi:hypothetical protein
MGEQAASDPQVDLLRLVKQYGWAVRHVLAGSLPTEPPFSYTVGLTARGHPEVVIVGLSVKTSKAFLDLVVGQIDGGQHFESNQMTSELTDGGSVALIHVEDTSGLTAIDDTYGSVNALQIVWPGSGGRYPWDTGYANAIEAQPLLASIPSKWVRK